MVTGAGNVNFNASGGYQGGTYVPNGTLVLNGADALAFGTSITIGSLGGGGGLSDWMAAPGRFGQGSQGLGGSLPPSTPVFAPPPVAPTGTPPAVSSINCVGNSLVDADSVQFNVVFSEAVTGVTPADFAAVTNGVTGAAIASVTGSGGDYTVTVSGIEGSGSVGLTLTDGSDILNALGNPLDPTATVPTSGVFTIDRTLYWDPSGGASAAGGTGIWDAGNVWHVGSETGPLQPYCEDSTVIFTGTPGTVTIANNVTVASMTFLTDGYVLQGAQISLASLQTTINVNAGTATIDCGLTGGGLLTTGPGTLVLCGVDSYMLSTTITTGVVTLRNSGALPGGTTLVVSGGVLDLGGYTTAEVPTVTLQGGSIVDGGLQVDNAIDLYSGTVSADLGGTAATSLCSTWMPLCSPLCRAYSRARQSIELA
jgi:fibronectin-binding autotransporter adhesin